MSKVDIRLQGFKYFSLTLVILAFIVYHAGAAVPRISITPNYRFLQLPEDFPIGGVLWSVTATDQDIDENLIVTMDANTRHFVDITKSSGLSPLQFNVTLKTELDKETVHSPINLRFIVTDQNGNEAPRKLDIYITDINDNAPIFQNAPYTWAIPEHPYNASACYTFSATDYDATRGYGKPSFTMEPTTQSPVMRTMHKETFNLTTEAGNVGKVCLLKPLDFRTNSYYRFTITATDGGGLNATTSLIILVMEVQNPVVG